jgi:O-antigen ligase
MSTTPVPARPDATPAHDWIQRALGVLATAAVGVLIGLQYVAPNKRVLQVIAAAVMFGVAWRLDTVTGLGVLLIALPFPRGTVFGNTNLALILLMLVVWLLRFATGHAARPVRSPLDAPIAALFLCYVVSFYNVAPGTVPSAFDNFLVIVSTFLMYWLIVGSVRTEHDLRRIHGWYVVALIVILLVCCFELVFPGRALVPGWITFEHTVTEGAEVRTLRIGGPFFDYELLAEFCALNLVFLVFMVRHVRTAAQRLIMTGVAGLTLLVLFATVTRGAIIALAAGLLYMGWLVRRRLRIVPLTITLVVVGAASLAIFTALEQFTLAGDLFARFGETQLVKGLPDSRAAVWPQAFGRWLQHPIIGWGPYYESQVGLVTYFWPHNLYLYYANTVGVLGLVGFLWIVVRLWKATTPATDDIGDPRYVEAYLLVARVQLALFLIDQLKIEYLRNLVYQFQIWVLFALWMAAHQIRTRARTEAPAATAAPAA